MTNIYPSSNTVTTPTFKPQYKNDSRSTTKAQKTKTVRRNLMISKATGVFSFAAATATTAVTTIAGRLPAPRTTDNEPGCSSPPCRVFPA